MTERLLCQDRYYRQPAMDYYQKVGYKRLIYDPGRVTRIIMNRPRYQNATSHAHLAELEDAFDRAAQDENCRVIVLSGAGRNFCAGDDVIGLTPEAAPTLWDGDARPPAKLIEEYGSESAVWYQYNTEHDHMVTGPRLRKLRMVPKPTIAMVHGYAIAMGAILAGACDVIFASEDALFLSLRSPVPSARISYEHRFQTARECLELGLVNGVFPDYETLERETMTYAYHIAHEPPTQLRHTKEAHLRALDMANPLWDWERTPFMLTWRNWAEAGHRMRYEGRGIARTPVALANLKRKLELEGKEVPAHVEAAIARAIERDDRGAWQRALHQDWRTGERVGRTDRSREAYDKMVDEEAEMVKAECERRGLSYEDIRSPYDRYVVSQKAKA